MYYFPDFLVFCCLFASGFFFGYYYKFAYVYDNLWMHWYTVLGVFVAFALAGVWTVKKYKERQYRFDHFYVIFYGLICFVISACFMLTDNLDISFYFGFIGHVTLVIPCYSFISLRSSSQGLRPARVAFGNALYYAGLTTGFSVFNEFEPKDCGWIYLGLTLIMILGAILNEVLQHCGTYDYKQSLDLVFNLMNDEKIVFLPTKSIYALFVGRSEFCVTTNRQWLVVAVSAAIVLERTFIYSPSFLQLSWSSTFAYMVKQYLYAPYLLYTIGCVLGCGLVIRYKPKLIYLMFALIKVTVIAAILGVYSEDLTENCFYFLCFYYISMGVYSSIALQMILECTPFLYTEIGLAVTFSMELLVFEVFKYETKADNFWYMLMGTGITMMCLSVISIILVQLFLPRSKGLIDLRNKLLGVRRYRPAVPQTKVWSVNYFLQHDLQPNEMTSVKIDGNRVFRQYPPCEGSEKKSWFVF